ncbi:probable inactive poly [ADP-ribose] polymerase SRO3 [Hibiscus syriacus]|nr:probable inactive poly [ADP-ribose] polymerase SRO3 [Hibiscus syriacus]
MKRLRETEREYLVVNNHFLSGISVIYDGVEVTSIYKFDWEAPRSDIFQKQNEIINATRGNSNVIQAWYGASARLVGSILDHGFVLPTKVPSTDIYGIGIYLSPLGLPHLSAELADADENGVTRLILCRVVLGEVEKVEAGSQQDFSSTVEFDTGSDDPKNPRWYVVWSNNAETHILPEFVVSFKPSSNMKGQVRKVCSLEKVFLKIRDSLPPAQFREVSTSYSTYRAGTLSKDDLMRKFRQVAGDEILNSVIMEVFASK